MCLVKCVEDYANSFRFRFPLVVTVEEVVEISLLTGCPYEYKGEKSESSVKTISRVMTTADEK